MNDNSDMKLFNFYSIKLLKKHFKNQQPMLTEIDHHRVSEQYMQNNLHECTTIWNYLKHLIVFQYSWETLAEMAFSCFTRTDTNIHASRDINVAFSSSSKNWIKLFSQVGLLLS